MRDVRDALMVARNSDGKLIRRPLSPHLQVYRWPISMALSIAHRITGVGLGVGTLLLTWWLVAAAVSERRSTRVQWFLATPIGMLLLFGWTLALFFHFFAGHPPSGLGCRLRLREALVRPFRLGGGDRDRWWRRCCSGSSACAAW